MAAELRKACYNGDLQSVERLLKEGVDVNYVCNTNTNTPLIAAVFARSCEVVQLLLMSGADVNRAVVKGRTAAHACVTASQLQCLKMLVDNGARLDMKFKGLTPLLLASRQGQAEIVKYLIGLPSCSRANKIEALEVLGAAYIDDREDPVNAHFYWSWSLEEREGAEPGDQVQPKSEQTHPVLKIKEFKTKDELNALEFATDKMWMQSLLITARVFGPGYITRRALAYAERDNFDRSITLMTCILDEENKCGHTKYSTFKSFFSHIEMFRKLMCKGSYVYHQHVMAVLSKIVDVFDHMKSAGFTFLIVLEHTRFAVRLNNSNDWGVSEDRNEMARKKEWTLTTCSRAFDAAITAVGLLAQLQPSMSADDNLKFRQVLSKFVSLDLRGQSGLTPLHLACLIKKSLYSPLDVVQLLLEAGADPGAVSASRETPLHVLQYSDHPTKPQIVQLLLDSGAHYDACNDDGQSFTELWGHGEPFMPENPMQYVSLQCLSARVVKRSGVPYRSKVPAIVAKFIDLH